MYPQQEVNPNCFALSNPNGEPILDGDRQRILEVCNEGDIAEVKELVLLVPERKLDGHVPSHASPLYEGESFAALAAKMLEDHDSYDGDDSVPFEGTIYHVTIQGFVCKILNSLTIKER